MSNNSGPSGWNVEKGDWSVDFDREDSLTVGGNAAIKIVGGGSAERVLTTDWVLVGEFDLVRTGVSAWLWLRSDSIAASGAFNVQVQYGNADLSSVTATKTILLGSLAAINTWEPYGVEFFPNSASRWVRLQFVFSAAHTATSYIGGYVITTEKPNAFTQNIDTPTALSVGSYVKVPFQQGNEDLIEVDGSGANEVAFKEPGSYLLVATAPLDQVASGDRFDMRMRHIRPSTTDISHEGPTLIATSSVSGSIQMHMSAIVRIADLAQTVAVEIRQVTGTARDIDGFGNLAVMKLGP